jgi:hypothetical protein
LSPTERIGLRRNERVAVLADTIIAAVAGTAESESERAGTYLTDAADELGAGPDEIKEAALSAGKRIRSYLRNSVAMRQAVKARRKA